MPSTVYKGDIAEVSFAPETGLVIRGADVTMTLSHSDDITTITFSAEANTTLFEAGTHKLRYPKNMLVGSQVVWEKGSTGNVVADADLISIFFLTKPHQLMCLLPKPLQVQVMVVLKVVR